MSIHDARSDPREGRSPAPPVLLFAALFVPLLPTVAMAVSLPRFRPAFEDMEVSLPTLTQWALDPRVVLVLAIVYAVQLVSLTVVWRVKSLNRLALPLALTAVVGWIIVTVAAAVGVFLPLLRIVRNI